MKPHRPHAPSQTKVLAFIKAEIEAGRPFPTDAAIIEHMGWTSIKSAQDVLMALAANRKLRPASRKPVGKGWRYTWEVVA